MKKNITRIYSKDKLEKLSTQRLKKYLHKLLECEESFELSDLDVNEDIDNTETVKFKNTDKWQKVYLEVKSILMNRENLE